jgi:phenylacetate-CoA ligase
MSIAQSIYARLPEWGQNAVVSAYGCKLYYERYHRTGTDLEDLLRSQWYSAGQVRDGQLAALGKLLAHAGATVPYYGELFRNAGFEPQQSNSLEHLARLPLLKKETLRTRGEQLLSSHFPSKGLVPLNTSGTTGTSLRVMVDLESRRRTYAFTGRFHRWAGLLNSRNNVTLGGRTIIPPEREPATFWRYNAAMGNYLFSTYHMSERNLPRYVAKIRDIQPSFIEAYPSAVFLLARFMAEHDLGGIHPRAVITSGETLLEHQREVIERVFRCKVFDQYGCTEQALFVSQCEQGSYHVHPEYGIVELLDDHDQPVGIGRAGRVVCTSFVNRAMPLIRYDLGDLAEWGENSCACGRHFPVIRTIIGRQDDYILTPDGHRIGRLDPVFKGVASVRMAQIIQQDLTHLTLLIVPGSNFCDADRDSIVRELHNRVGNEMGIQVEYRDRIAMSANGKYKAVVSCLDQRGANHQSRQGGHHG